MIQDDINKAIEDGLAIEIVYTKYNGDSSIRILSEVGHSEEYGRSHISAYCHTRQEQRTFKIDRIVSLRFLDGKLDNASVSSIPGQTYVFNPLKKIFKL